MKQKQQCTETSTDQVTDRQQAEILKGQHSQTRRNAPRPTGILWMGTIFKNHDAIVSLKMCDLVTLESSQNCLKCIMLD